MAQVRKIAGLAVFSVIGLVALVWTAAGLWAISLGPSWFSGQLKQRAGIQAAIGSVRTNFLTTLSFRDIVVAAPVRGRIDEVLVSFRPWDLFSLRFRNRHLFLVTFVHPDLEVPDTRLSSGSLKAHGPLRVIPFGARVRDGRIAFTKSEKVWQIENINGAVGATPFRIEAETDANIAGVGFVHAHLRSACMPPRNWEVRLSADSLDLAPIVTLLPDHASRYGTISGHAGADLEMKGSWGKSISMADWRLRLKPTGVTWQRANAVRPIALTGSLEASPRLLRFAPLKIGQAISLEGDVRTPWQNPDMNLRVKLARADIEEILEYGLEKPLPFTGEMTASAEIRGHPQDPSIEAHYDFSGAFGRMHLPQATGDALYSSGALESTTSFAGGQLLVSAIGVRSPTPVWSVSARGLSVSALGKENGWTNVGGTVGARFFVRGSPAVLTGHVDTSALRWARLNYEGAHTSSIRLSRNDFIIRADDGSISMTAARKGPHLHIDGLTLALGKAGNISVDGDIDTVSRQLDLNVNVSGVSPDVWPPLVDRYPDLSGDVSGKGRINGSMNAPAAHFDVSWTSVRFDPDEDPYDGGGQLIFDSNQVALEHATVAKGYAGRAVWHRNSRSWEATLRLDDADPSLLWDVANASGDASGDISGELDIQGGDTIVASSSFTWSTGQINDFSFDEAAGSFDWNGDRISIHGASLIKGGQAIRGQAELLKANTGWTFNSVAQVQRWGTPPLTVDGEVHAEGKVDFKKQRLDAALTTPVLWIADRSVEDLKAHLHGDDSRWTLTGTSDDKANFNLSVDRNSGTLGGTLAAHDLRLGDIFPNAGKAEAAGGSWSPPSGTYDIEAALAGTLSDPQARIRATLRDGIWREEPFSAEAVIDVARSTITVATAKVALKAGGEVFAHGDIGVGKDAPIRIEGAGSAVDLQAIFHWLAWPVHWNGHADTTFTLLRNGGPLSADIRFDGEHDGFGPFREGGSLRGEISGREREWNLAGVFVESGDGHVQLREGSKLYLDKSGAATLRVVGDVRNVRLGPLTLFGGAEVVGHWKDESEGTRKIGLDLFARSLYINQFVLDGNVTRISIEDQNILFSPIPGSGQQLSGTLSYDHYPDLIMKDFRFLEGGKEKISLSGNVGAARWDFTARARGVDAAIVRGLLDTSLTMSGPMDLDVVGKGSPTDPDITAGVRWTNGRVGILPLDLAEGKFSYKGGEVRLDDVTVQRKRGYQASGSAHVGIGDDTDVPMEINVRVDKGDAALLTGMFPEVSQAKGSFDGRLRIGGSAGLATISGYFNAQKLLVRSTHTPRLDKGELRVHFDKNRLLVDKAAARLGHGDVVGGGYVDFKNGFPDRYNLTLKSAANRGAEIRVPELAIAAGTVLSHFRLFKNELAGISRGEPVIDLEFNGPADSPTLAGTVTLENTVFTYPSSTASSGSQSAWWRDFIDRVNWDVTLTAGRRTWYQNELVDAAVSGNVNIRGPHDDLDVTGKVHSEQGSIVYSGNEFVIKSADLEIDTRKPVLASDQKQTVVYLKATAERDVFYTDALANNNHDVIVMVVDRAPIGEIQPRFYSKSNPNLSSQRALQLALGLPFGDSIETNSLLPDQRAKLSDSADSDKLLRLGLIQLLDSNLASPLARAIARRTGLVDYIRVTYQENDPHAQEGVVDIPDKSNTTDVNQNQFLKYAKGTQVRVGRELGGRLFADYSFRVDQYESSINLRHELELAYRVHNNLFLRGTSELANERALGRPPDRRAILENQWRFGLPRRKTPAPPAAPAPALPPAEGEKPKAG